MYNYNSAIDKAIQNENFYRDALRQRMADKINLTNPDGTKYFGIDIPEKYRSLDFHSIYSTLQRELIDEIKVFIFNHILMR